VKPESQTPLINLKMKIVLVVDDFFNFRLTMKNMLRSFGMNYIDDATTGEEAIRKLALRRYDIILCDYNLGHGKSGQQILEEAKFRGYINYSSVFIMVTAENTLEMIMGAAEYEPDDYLMKPFAKEVLEKKIRNLIEKKENFKDIDKKLKENDYTHAINLCEELMGSLPRNLSELMKLKGEILLKKGSYQEAAEFYEKVLLVGDFVWGQLGRGKANFMLGKYEEAKEIFEKIITKNNKIMPAYDYLAKIMMKMNYPKEAQEILMKAISISPRAILRQKNLGNIAYGNEDYSTAESSFKAAVEQGKNSCFQSTSDYTSLAKTLVQRDAPDEGLGVLNDALKVFPNSSDARLHVSVTESYVYKKMHKEKEAQQAMAEAQKLAQELDGKISTEIMLDLAKAHIIMGEEDKGTEIIKHIVRGNHDNDEMLDNVRLVFKETGMADRGENIIEVAREEIIQLNNEGVKLAQDGKLAKAIIYFEKAAAQLPENKIINANAAQVLMLYMKENGVNEQQLFSAKKYLDRVREIDETYSDIPLLLSLYRELVPEVNDGK
jgi:tetratricopeptide (TPR) repeat protein